MDNCSNIALGPSLANTCYGGTYIFFMSLVDNLIRSNERISETCQRITPKFHPDPEYDFVVIGGGSAGAVVAGRLSENPQWKVLLIEAGGDEPPGSQVPSMMTNFVGNPDLDWNFKTEPQEKACLGYPERRCNWPRGKVLGGTGVLHGMMYMRGTPKDYDKWENMGNPGWGYKDVLPYFKKSEDNLQVGQLVRSTLHGTGGPMTTSRFPDHPHLAESIMKAARELNYSVVKDLNDGNHAGFTIAQANIRNGVRLSSARAYLRPARNRTNLHIMLNSLATKVVLIKKRGKKTASKVKFIHRGKTYNVKIRKEAIISGGTINSPQILLLSGIGPKNELKEIGIEPVHDLPGVGKNLQNHVSFSLTFLLKLVNATTDLDFSTLLEYIQVQRGPMSSSGMKQVTARLTTKYGQPGEDNPDLQLFFDGFAANCSRSGTVGEPLYPSHPEAAKSFVISPVVLRPKSVGYIKLRSNNPVDYPLLYPNYLTDQYDVNILIEGIRVAQKIGATNILKKKYGAKLKREKYGNCEENYKYDSDLYWECAIRHSTSPENHQSSSCKMGPSSDPLAVVDSELQVHGVQGLRVIDFSVVPNVVSGNPHGTIVMIAEKGAELLTKKWSDGHKSKGSSSISSSLN